MRALTSLGGTWELENQWHCLACSRQVGSTVLREFGRCDLCAAAGSLSFIPRLLFKRVGYGISCTRWMTRSARNTTGLSPAARADRHLDSRISRSVQKKVEMALIPLPTRASTHLTSHLTRRCPYCSKDWKWPYKQPMTNSRTYSG